MIRVATFNVNSIRSRIDIVCDWLSTHKPDILALQETKVVDADFPIEPFLDAGYHVCFRGEKSYNGVALISREKPSSVQFGFDDVGPADAARLLRADFADFSLVNTYVPQGRSIDHPMYAYKAAWFERLRSWFDKHFTPKDSLLWVGDMNVATEPIDVHNPEKRTKHVCYHEVARAAFAKCRNWGFHDVFRLHHPEPGHYTFYDYRNPDNVQQGKGWRIDYILATKPMARHCSNAFIDVHPRLQARPSDHVVLAADFSTGMG